ncbi:glycosyltransferase [Flavobacterium sp. 3HN19-14]
MADFMMQLLENPEKAKKMGENGRSHIIENYTQKNQIGKIYALAKESALV